MNMILMDSATASDEQLWRLACEGDREAFGRIVERYQALLCSLAYSACGTLGTSEDMAQETFITAWHRLKDLREPGKLRQWLCGIVRNIAANAVRRELRRGGAPASLEAVADEASPDDDPAAQAVTREEETLLWRTLAELPASYREPLVLFQTLNIPAYELISTCHLDRVNHDVGSGGLRPKRRRTSKSSAKENGADRRPGASQRNHHRL